MPIFTKRPSAVSAVQWGSPYTPLPVDGVQFDGGWRPFVITWDDEKRYLRTGDWIVTDLNSTGYYVIDDETFYETYEEANRV